MRPVSFRLHACALACAVGLLTVAAPAQAGWPSSSNVNLAVCTAPGQQAFRTAVSDGALGLIVAWVDTRNDSADIYAQRVDAGGNLLWFTNGVRVCGAVGDQDQPTLVSDGAGGAIVVWRDFRGGGAGDVYAQRVNAAGAPMWTLNGVVVCALPGEQANPVVAVDGMGGAVVAWEDSRAALVVYAQRLSSAGVRRWPGSGVALAPMAPQPQFEPAIATDGTNGAIVTWTQSSGTDLDVVAQRVNDVGGLEWGGTGRPLSSDPGDQFHARVMADGLLGAVFAWEDHRSGVGQVHVQRVNHWGAILWGADGIVAGAGSGDQFDPALTSDGSGGAVVGWHDLRGASADVWAQRVDASAVRRWGAAGIPVCTAAGTQQFVSVAPDGSGGALLSWEDERSGGGGDIYAQRVNGAGTVFWVQQGVPVSTAPGSQYQPVVTSPSDSVGVVVWVDQRAGGSDLFAQRVPMLVTLGAAGGAPRAFALSAAPNPTRDACTVRFVLPIEGEVALEVLDVLGRRVRSLAAGWRGAGVHESAWDGRDEAGRESRAGLYFVRLRAAGGTTTVRVTRLED